MPELGKLITKRIDFPEYPEDDPAFAIIVCNPKGDVYINIPEDADDKDAYMLAKIIIEWNFTLEGKTVEINPENITKALGPIDRMLILREIGLDSVLSDVKKNKSSLTSRVSEQTSQPNTSSSNIAS